MFSFLGSQERVGDDLIFVPKLFAEFWEEAPRRFIQLSQEIDVMLRLLNPDVELLAVIADRDELDNELLSQEDQTADQETKQYILDGLLP